MLIDLQSRRKAAQEAKTAAGDWALLCQCRDQIRTALDWALLDCTRIARDMGVVDPDQFIEALRKQFDGLDPASPIQDCFSEAFADAFAKVRDTGGEPVSAYETLPSGAPFPTGGRRA